MPATTPLKNWMASSIEIYTKLIKQGVEYECFVRYVLLPALFYASILLLLFVPIILGGYVAYLSLVSWGMFLVLGHRYYVRHHLEGMDCRLSDERMNQARDWWIREVKKIED